MTELAKRYVDRMAELGQDVRLRRQVAVRIRCTWSCRCFHKLPESDFQRMLTLTQELFGGGDRDGGAGATPEELIGAFARLLRPLQG